MHEIVVVGCGVAGTTTAIHLARAGHEVLLLDRGEQGRRKPCGEGLFPRGVRELAALGVLDGVRHRAHPLTGVRFHLGAAEVDAPFGPDGPVGLGVERTLLDARLLETARDAGVEVRTGVAVRSLLVGASRVCGVRLDDGDVEARVVVGADGLNSRLRREAGLERARRRGRYGVSAHARIPGLCSGLVDVYFERGYEVYVTPVGDATVNVALLTRGRASSVPPRAFLTALRGSHMALPTSAEWLDEPVAAGPFAAGCTRPWRDNLVLVGDAAGFLDPIAGEGMSTALVSARWCADAVAGYLHRSDERTFAEYARRRRDLVRNADLLARLSLWLAARPSLAARTMRNLRRRPGTFARLVAASTGEQPLGALRPRDVLAFAFGV